MPKPPALLSSLKMLDDSTAELQIMDEIVRDSGWLGGDPRTPKSFGVSTRPVPK